MKYKEYAKALFEAYQEKNEVEFQTFFENFIKILKNKKQIKLLPKILKEIQKIFEENQKENKTEIILKNKNDFEKFKDKISTFSEFFDLENIEIQEKKNIIGGFILKNSKNILDKSYKTALLNLYKKITK